ncbi:MAG: dirigent protein [Actinomycetota bacterium]|nr:dirigent protein [Actinomycetota bacterium]MDH5313859.1 dirigent protein [Actinomycetota bacterium]
MRTIAIAVATGLLLAAVAIGTIPAGAGAGPTVITVVERATTDKVIDVGRRGDSPGDLLTFANRLFDETNTTKVGRDQGSCIRISRNRGLWQCSWTSFLEGGSLTVEGPFFDDRESDLAITGGTGAYSAATGSMHLGFRDDPAEFDFVYSINP